MSSSTWWSLVVRDWVRNEGQIAITMKSAKDHNQRWKNIYAYKTKYRTESPAVSRRRASSHLWDLCFRRSSEASEMKWAWYLVALQNTITATASCYIFVELISTTWKPCLTPDSRCRSRFTYLSFHHTKLPLLDSATKFNSLNNRSCCISHPVLHRNCHHFPLPLYYITWAGSLCPCHITCSTNPKIYFQTLQFRFLNNVREQWHRQMSCLKRNISCSSNPAVTWEALFSIRTSNGASSSRWIWARCTRAWRFLDLRDMFSAPPMP